MKQKIKTHLWTLPRWFATPFFASSCLMGSVLAGGLNLHAWIAMLACILIMAGGHSFNSYLDYAWTELDKGESQDRSAEKDYTGGQNVISAGVVSLKEVLSNALGWYVLSAIPVVYLAINVSSLVYIPWVLGMLVTFWYSWAKFNYTHELALGVAVGPLPALLGAYAVSAHPHIVGSLMVSVLVAIILSFIGLALDEWPDAEANLKKGVKSIAYMVWQYSPFLPTETKIGDLQSKKDILGLQWYCTAWLSFLYLFQIFLIVIGVLNKLTGWTFIIAPFLLAMFVVMRGDFRKSMRFIVAIAAAFPVILLVTQIVGGN
jgi:1,4-dihydroxy-2-naphthoate octaprenyltransferase